MTRTSKTLVLLTALLGATAALAAGNQDQLRAQLKDGSCLDPAGAAASADCLYAQDQDQIRLQLKDGTCLIEDGTGDETCDQLQTRTRARIGADNGQGSLTRSEAGTGSN